VPVMMNSAAKKPPGEKNWLCSRQSLTCIIFMFQASPCQALADEPTWCRVMRNYAHLNVNPGGRTGDGLSGQWCHVRFQCFSVLGTRTTPVEVKGKEQLGPYDAVPRDLRAQPRHHADHGVAMQVDIESKG